MVDVVPKEIEEAKEKISGGDYLGARNILLQVKRNFPALDDISGILAVCDTLFSASLGFMDCDFYFVLQIPPEATNSEIEASYNKLTSLIEPIANANNFPAAASALRMVQDAYSGLLNPEQRKVFDDKRARKLECYASGILDSEATETLCQTHENSSSCESSKMGTYKAGDDMITDAEVSINLGETQPQSSCLKDCNQDYYNFVDARKRDIYSVGQIWATYDEEDLPRKYAQITWIDESSFRLFVSWLNPLRVTAHERKWYEAKMPVVCGVFNLDGNVTAWVEPTLFSHLISAHASEQVGIYPQSGEVWAIYKDWRPMEWLSNPKARKECRLEIVEIIDGYFNLSDVVVKRLVKVEGFKTVFRRSMDKDSDHTFAIPAKSLYKFSHKIPAYRFSGQEIDGISEGMFQLDHLALPNAIPVPKPSAAEAKSLKHKWSIAEFSPEQVWAIYKGQDLMPRRYVVVNNAVSWNKVSVTLLEPFPMLVEEISWVQSNLPLATGSFKRGETRLDLDLSRFSHSVNCEKMGEDQSLYRIYPKKGEVWAIYKNFDGSRKPADVNSDQCRLVETVTDFSEESGVMAVSLIEVPGWNSFFQRQQQDGYRVSHTVSRKEMIFFSHQVPAHTVEGIDDSHGIPKGSWHVEPDALPLTISTLELSCHSTAFMLF
ncbi:hypothetical protein CCACVL1_10113 [Corchorus capsularis]|uniref:J domain-containing protein n=1 Tax=Corchorus capsularis TaxID=210143 RepID=A0A1R3ISI1_COCAP|nr:hypothetical protein CCACVL1_10113 [Corchorus capsularis]